MVWDTAGDWHHRWHGTPQGTGTIGSMGHRRGLAPLVVWDTAGDWHQLEHGHHLYLTLKMVIFHENCCVAMAKCDKIIKIYAADTSTGYDFYIGYNLFYFEYLY